MCITLTKKMVKKQEVSKKETTFHLPNDLVISLKMRAVQENRAYSAVAEEAIQEYLSKKKQA
jgi:predicted transcriptional regulator